MFNRFKRTRFWRKPEPKTYQKYEPKTESIFHKLNRGFSQAEFMKHRPLWLWFKGVNPFKIKDYQHERRWESG